MNIISRIKKCDECIDSLPFAPRPILQYSQHAKIIIIGQAPGKRAHDTQTPWDDLSGDRLRVWLNIDKETFYDKNKLSIMPMGFCYPGKGKSGDLPPRPECAPKWHPLLITSSTTTLTLLIGKYAQDYYLKDKKSLTERLKNWQLYYPNFLLLPHPSPRNNIWLKKNEWFETEVLPKIQQRINANLTNSEPIKGT